MALSVPNTVNDILTAMRALPATATDTDRWTAAVTAIYTRIKADIQVGSVVASGIAVATTGSSTAQTGDTTATGSATSNSVT